MATKGGPNIVTEGLVLYFDNSNTKSYPTTGNTWYDLSGNNNDGAFDTTPTFETSFLGGINFDGTSDGVTVTYNASSMDFSLAQTICMWLKPGIGASTARRNPYNQAYGGSGTLTLEPAKTINYYFGTNGGNASPYVGRNSSFTIEEEELAFITVSRDQATDVCRWYKNSILYSSATAGGYATVTNSTADIWIAKGYTGRFLGDIYSCIVYNKYLSQKEVSQIYNATKRRFNQ